HARGTDGRHVGTDGRAGSARQGRPSQAFLSHEAMLPLAAPSAVFAFFGSVAMLVIALVAESATAVTFAGGALLGRAAPLAMTAPLAARLRRQRLECAWWLGQSDAAQQSGPGVVAGATFEVRCYVRNRGREPLRFCDLLPVVPAGVRVAGGLGAELWIPPR